MVFGSNSPKVTGQRCPKTRCRGCQTKMTSPGICTWNPENNAKFVRELRFPTYWIAVLKARAWREKRAAAWVSYENDVRIVFPRRRRYPGEGRVVNGNARFGHSTKKCKNKATCNKCAGAHLSSKCTSATYKCPNSDFSNEKYKTKYNVNHSAINSDLCEILRTKIKKYIEKSDYPTQPT